MGTQKPNPERGYLILNMDGHPETKSREGAPKTDKQKVPANKKPHPKEVGY